MRIMGSLSAVIDGINNSSNKPAGQMTARERKARSLSNV